jgi:hypothetical protein
MYLNLICWVNFITVMTQKPTRVLNFTISISFSNEFLFQF